MLKDVPLPVQEDFDILQKWNTLLPQVFRFIVEVAYLTYNARDMWRLLYRCRHTMDWMKYWFFWNFIMIFLWHCFCQSYNFIIPARTDFCMAVWIAFKSLNVNYDCWYKIKYELLTQIAFMNLLSKNRVATIVSSSSNLMSLANYTFIRQIKYAGFCGSTHPHCCDLEFAFVLFLYTRVQLPKSWLELDCTNISSLYTFCLK